MKRGRVLAFGDFDHGYETAGTIDPTSPNMVLSQALARACRSKTEKPAQVLRLYFGFEEHEHGFSFTGKQHELMTIAPIIEVYESQVLVLFGRAVECVVFHAKTLTDIGPVQRAVYNYFGHTGEGLIWADWREPVCAECQWPIMHVALGRPREFCSNACRQRSHRARKTISYPTDEATS